VGRHSGLSPRSRRRQEVFVAELDGHAIGWAALIPQGEVVWLDDMWVEPEWIGKTVGSLLFRHSVERATRLGGTRMEWEAEPNAVGFYEKLGGRYLRDSEPTEWGRVLPVMGVDLESSRH
jgi:GNAT superfamily N-acetyltransferase